MNFEGIIIHHSLKAKQSNDQIGKKNTMPTLHKNDKESDFGI